MEELKYLIISTIPDTDDEIQNTLRELRENLEDMEVIFTDKMKIENCKGCTSCWLITPGKCPIKDDYEQQVFKKLLKAENVIYIAEAKYGFVTHTMKNLVDRILPVMTMYLRFYNGEMRHVSRYKKTWNIGLLFKGQGEADFLNEWMSRYTLNLHSKSLGAYHIKNRKELIHELGNI
jgi:multimeric flavodoxin WrbA